MPVTTQPSSGAPAGASVSTAAPSGQSWLIFVVLTLIWGASFLFIKEGLKVLTPLQVGTMRIAVAGIVLWPIAFGILKKIPLRTWPLFFLSGLMGNLLPSVLFSIAGGQLASSISGCLNAFTPMFTMLIGVVLFKTRLAVGQVVGLLFGLVGAILLATKGGNLDLTEINPYAGLVLIATLLYAFNVNFIKFRLAGYASVENAVMALFLSSLPAIGYLAFDLDFQDRVEVATATHPGILAVVALGILGSAVGTLLFNKMIKQTSAVFSSSVTYLIPFVAVAIGLFIGEPFSLLQGIGLVATIVGVWLVNKK